MKTTIELTANMLFYEDAIKEALPHALINHVDNFDDVTYGWMISPKPGHLLIFKVLINDDMIIIIEKFILNHFNGQVERGKIFSGKTPINENYEPDHNFIMFLLQNYISIA